MRSIAFATFAAGAPLGAAVGNTLGAVLTQLSESVACFTASPSFSESSLIPVPHGVPYFSSRLASMFSVSSEAPSLSTLINHQQKPIREWTILAPSSLLQVSRSLFSSSATEALLPMDGLPRVCYLYPRPACRILMIALDIIAFIVLGIVLLSAFLLWQHYLEKRLDNEHLPARRRLPPPIMRLSLWRRANGRFAVMQMIAFLNWCSFMAYNFWVQLFYQDYLRLSPVQTMVRLLPMFVTGVVWYVLFPSSSACAYKISLDCQRTATLSSHSWLAKSMLCG